MAVAVVVAAAAAVEEVAVVVEEALVVDSLVSRRVHLLQQSRRPRRMQWLQQLQQEAGPEAEEGVRPKAMASEEEAQEQARAMPRQNAMNRGSPGTAPKSMYRNLRRDPQTQERRRSLCLSVVRWPWQVRCRR